MEALTPLQRILDSIHSAKTLAGRSDLITLVAVSKFQSFDKIKDLYREGQRIFGENYVQELIEKREEANREGLFDLDFHFIGHLQSNKVKILLPAVSTIHSVDSLKLYREIEKRANELKKSIRVYFQINIDDEETKSGFRLSELDQVATAICSSPWVVCMGLMAIPNPEKSVETSFAKMKALSELYGEKFGSGLSLGMSQDFESAIRFGSTSVRVGSALFGPRV